MQLPIPTLFARALIALGLLACGAAFAADSPKTESSFGGGKPGGAFLTRDELRACMAQQSRVAQDDAEMLKEKAALAALKDEVTRSGATLKEELDALDHGNAEAVAAYNQKAQARDTQIDAYQSRVGEFNARVETTQAQRSAFGKDCQNRRYFEEDAIAIRKGK